MIRHCFVIGVACLFATACSDTYERGPINKLIESLGQSVILPTLADFSNRSATLATAANSFCTTPNEDSLQHVRFTWGHARESWKRLDVLRFGPYDAMPERLGPKIDSWPVRPDTIDGLLSGTIDLTAPGAFELLGASARGLPAIEYAVFHAGALPETLLAFSVNPRECQYLRGATLDLASNAAQYLAKWAPEGGNYLGQLVDAGVVSATFATPQHVISEFINQIVFTLEEVRDNRLGRPLGNRTNGVAQPDQVESRFANRSIADIENVLEGVESMFLGRYSANVGQGLSDHLRSRGVDLNAAFALRIASARASLKAIAIPLSVSIAEAPATVQSAIDALKALQIFFQVDVAMGASVTIVFGGSDGD